MLLNQKNAKASNRAAKTNVGTMKADLERYKDLYKDGIVSKQQLDIAQAKYDKANADLTTANENLLTAEGMYVAPGSPLFAIVPNDVWIVIERSLNNWTF